MGSIGTGLGCAGLSDGVAGSRQQLLRAIPVFATIAMIAGSTVLLFARLGHYALWTDEASTAITAAGVWRTGDTTAWLDDPIFRTMAIEAPDLADWHTFAYVLAELFRACVATTNPKYLGYANGGPTPRFLAGAIPLISGETPSEGTIAAKLKAVVKAMKAGGADALAAGRQVAILTGNSDR